MRWAGAGRRCERRATGLPAAASTPPGPGEKAGTPRARTTGSPEGSGVVVEHPGAPRRHPLPAQPGAGCGGAALEPLVLTVAALDGERAPTLLAGLGEPHRAAALRLLARLQRRSRAERHAALALAFAPRPSRATAAAGVTGVLGERVRALVAGDGAAEVAELPQPLERWARRLAQELGDAR